MKRRNDTNDVPTKCDREPPPHQIIMIIKNTYASEPISQGIHTSNVDTYVCNSRYMSNVTAFAKSQALKWLTLATVVSCPDTPPTGKEASGNYCSLLKVEFVVIIVGGWKRFSPHCFCLQFVSQNCLDC